MWPVLDICDSYQGMKGLEAHITLKSNVKPIFVKARRVPYARKVQVEKELEKLETHGVIKKTDKSRYLANSIYHTYMHG